MEYLPRGGRVVRPAQNDRPHCSDRPGRRHPTDRDQPWERDPRGAGERHDMVRVAANYLIPLVVSTLGYLSATRATDGQSPSS